MSKQHSPKCRCSIKEIGPFDFVYKAKSQVAFELLSRDTVPRSLVGRLHSDKMSQFNPITLIVVFSPKSIRQIRFPLGVRNFVIELLSCFRLSSNVCRKSSLYRVLYEAMHRSRNRKVEIRNLSFKLCRCVIVTYFQEFVVNVNLLIPNALSHFWI